VSVRWRGRSLPGCFVQHHMAHAAVCYYRSEFDAAAVLTHDGFLSGTGYHSGLNLYGEGHRLWPVSPNHLTLGMAYNFAAEMVGLGLVHGAGKLMGLAPYGQPVFFDSRFVGNEIDIRRQFDSDLWTAWSDHCRKEATARGYDISALGDPARVTDAVNADIAASTQKLFEETYLKAVRSLDRMLSGGGIRTDNLCLSGGTALNCPSNSRIWREGPFDNVFIEPTCDDGGLAIGAALHIYHNLLEQPRRIETTPPSPYLGIPYGESAVEAALETASGIVWSQPEDPAAAAAADLIGNKIIAWFEGGSEAGPRALGHRSILADVRNADNWRRVNHVKGRELWRPFAPIVLAEKAADWFDGCPMPSPYMLFTATVRSTDLPAITHVDGSSRIQTVDASCGGIRHVLEAFDRETGVPVLMNTSFNGPGEPIVETPAHAVAFLQNSDLDVVYIEGRRAVRS
ncbi:MAG: carbamoyltransferase C-terminal domain-containing protein, partial [Pseudomonadota bacterium]|nr:carbamoyltransferase C-terminal domain-containing protein [Pseudomonadota bacterium]